MNRVARIAFYDQIEIAGRFNKDVLPRPQIPPQDNQARLLSRNSDIEARRYPPI